MRELRMRFKVPNAANGRPAAFFCRSMIFQCTAMSVLLQVALASYTFVHLLLLAAVAHGNVAGKRHDGSNM